MSPKSASRNVLWLEAALVLLWLCAPAFAQPASSDLPVLDLRASAAASPIGGAVHPVGDAPTLGSSTSEPAVNHHLEHFAGAVASFSRSLVAATHDLESARLMLRKSRTTFHPKATVNQFQGKTANRTYNEFTGQDDDYTTRRRGTSAVVQQRTFFGTARVEVERSRTDYATSVPSYFESMYLGLETGLVQRSTRLMNLERRLDKGQYTIEEARTDALLLDTLRDGFSDLLDLLISRENHGFKLRNLGFYRTLVEEAEVKCETGLGSELDLKQARMRLTLAESDLEESRLVLDETGQRLGLVLGTSTWDPVLASFTPADVASLVPEVPVASALMDRALMTRPDLRVVEGQLKFQEDRLRLAREKAKPEINANLRWGKQGRGANEDLAREKRDKSWDVTVSWNTPLGPSPEALDKGIERQRLAALRARRDQARAAAAKTLQEATDRLRFHRQNLLDLRASAALSGEVLEGQRLNFQLGKVSLLDLSRYQSEYEAACLSVIRGEAALVQAWIRLLHETGELASVFGVAALHRASR